eukprot:4924340-Pyramimonas_sp.AAC.1
MARKRGAAVAAADDVDSDPFALRRDLAASDVSADRRWAGWDADLLARLRNEGPLRLLVLKTPATT